jgi:FkbM family methyltransferase
LQNIILSFAAFVARILPVSFRSSLYKNPSISKAIRQGLNQAAPEGLNETTIAAGNLAGTRMLLDLKAEKDYWLGTYEPQLQAAIQTRMLLDLKAEKDYWLGTYEPQLQATIQELVLPGQIVYDIGANIGFMTLLFAQCVESTGHVYAFEALPANLQRLRDNIALNAVDDRVTIISAAVNDRSNSTKFYIGPSSGTGKLVKSAGRSTITYRESIEVEGISIDDFIYQSGNPAPDILKIDIEGGEVLALPGMSRMLHEKRPVVMIELHGQEAARVGWDLLKKENYRICHMAADFPPILVLQEIDWKSYWVAFPDDR